MDEKRLQEIEARFEACDEFHDLRCPSTGQATMDDARELLAEVKRLHAGEFICKRCGIRKDADASLEPPTF